MKNKITKVYEYLLGKKYISEIFDVTGSFSDEPQFPYYITLIHPEIDFYNRNGWEYTPTGNTWDNSEMALLKCLMEMLERTSQFYFDFNFIQFYKKKDIPLPHINTNIFLKNIPSKKEIYSIVSNKKFGWVNGINITQNIQGLIPAQLIYPNYSQYICYEKDNSEITLVPSKSTFQGSASGFDHSSTLLRAIYEVVEREARTLFITLKHKAKILDISKIRSKKLATLLKILDKYKFDIYIFNIMNDLNIPVIMTLLVDKSGVGPIINTGFKSGLKLEDTIIGSIEDTFYQRYFQRIDIIRNQKMFQYPDNLNVFENIFNKRVIIFKETYKRLFFQFKDPLYEKIQPITSDFINKKANNEQELNEVVNRIKKAGFDIWYKPFDTIKGVYTYKAVIPGLQPSIRDESLENYYQNRLIKTQEYYKKSPYYVQTHTS